MKEIIITLDDTGASKIKTTGFRGKECKDATKEIEIALSGKEAEANRKATPEMSLTPLPTANRIRN